jgi:hypothetical protein
VKSGTLALMAEPDAPLVQQYRELLTQEIRTLEFFSHLMD